MLYRASILLGVRPGNIQNGMHAVRTSQLPYVPWKFDSRYSGSSASAVIARFKKNSFPKTRFPKELLERKVEEISAMAEKMKLKNAIVAMELLNDSKYHNDNNQIR